jgi:hypothetical protein
MDQTGPRRTALITGASAGIGLAFARVFAGHGFNLVLTARREDRLQAIAADLAQQYGVNVRTITADLADPGSPKRLADELEEAGVAIDALVNNAGYGLPGRYASTAWEDQARFIQVMITACAELAHRLVPGMLARQYGRIINVASVAGIVPGSPGHTLYGASKAFLIKFSQSLGLETRRHNVYVTALCPGFTYSEFHDVNNTREMVSQMPKWMWLDADRVAREGYRAVMRGRFVHVPGLVYRTMVFFVRHLPESWVLRATLSQSRKFRRQ